MSGETAAGMSVVSGVQYVEVSAERAGQRLDNFLLGQLKGLPRPHVYRILRTGEVRVNGRRAKPEVAAAAPVMLIVAALLAGARVVGHFVVTQARLSKALLDAHKRGVQV